MQGGCLRSCAGSKREGAPQSGLGRLSEPTNQAQDVCSGYEAL